MGSIFQPDYAGFLYQPEASPHPLIGFGGYVDFGFRRYLQFEAEGRWLRFNQYLGIYQDHYLIGPRIPIRKYGKFTPYGKALFGWGTMDSPFFSSRSANIALGGGVDYELNRKLSVRMIDFEYQLWPNWVDGTLKPYGASVGMAYKIF